VERSGIGTSALLVAVHPAALGDGDGDRLGDGDADGDADGDELGDGDGDGLGPTVNDRVSADGPFPARSIVYIAKVYAPAASPLYSFGEVQGVHAPLAVSGPSRLHSNLSSSSAMNSNDAVVAGVTGGGPLGIHAVGGA
jgi:hypothetical protein